MTSFLDPHFLINTFGLVGVIAIVFAESGLFFGFFFPGDSLLFTAGLLASQGFLNPAILFLGVIAAAILGDNVGYTFGRKVGPAIFTKENSLFFNKKYIERARTFYEKYGNKTIVLARFVPIVRTFAPIVAGVGSMNYKKFFTYNCLGGILWSILLLGLGFTLGKTVPGIDKYLLPIVIFIIVASFLPGVYHLIKRE
jgi:membrane-associated protein